MKRLIAILCTALCILSLTACGQTEAELAKQEQKDRYDQEKIEMVEQYLFTEMLGLINYLTDDKVYYVASCYDNEELEYLFNDEQNQFYVDGHGLSTAVESFRISKETSGELKMASNGYYELGTVTAKIVGNQIIANADVECEKRSANIELIFSNDMFMRLEGGALNPKSSFQELMGKAGMNTLIGMATVFAVLILISLIIACFGFIPKIQAAFAKKEEAPATPTAPVATPVVTPAAQEEDDTELVAVIAAAIAAYEGSTNTEGFVVRSIRRRF